MDAGERRGAGSLFGGLSGGRGGSLTPEEVGANQRRRLQAAMIAAVARHGYAGATVRELVELAGVSKSTFYEHYASKEELFRATYADTGEAAIALIVDAYQSGKGLRERLRAAIMTFSEVVAADPKTAALVVVESLALGVAFAVEREATAMRFEELLAAGFAESGVTPPSPIVRRGIVGGYRRLVYRALRDGRPERLGSECDEAVEWILAYGNAATAAPKDGGDPRATAPDHPGHLGEIAWHEPPDSKLARRTLTQRERIMRAVAQRSVAGGYGKLTVPAISSAAGISNQTFYEEFGDKLAAFLATFEALSAPLVSTVEERVAAEEGWEAGVRSAITGLLGHLASDRLFARLAFFELPAAGAAGLDEADRLVDRLAAPLHPTPSRPAPAEAPAITREAIPGGIWTILQSESRKGRRRSLPDLREEICEFVLVPFRERR